MDNSGDLIQVDIFGLSLSPSISGGGYAIILKEVSGDRRLPIIIGQNEAQAIALELEGIKPPRPLTHDLTKSIIEYLGYNIESITINDLRDSTFFAKIKFDIPTIEDIDARPSDAIALALKFSAPIYVSSQIMNDIGFIPQVEGKEENGDKSAGTLLDGVIDKSYNDDNTDSKEKTLEKLKTELDSAVSNEDYEKAAMLRDEIKKLEISNLN